MINAQGGPVAADGASGALALLEGVIIVKANLVGLLQIVGPLLGRAVGPARIPAVLALAFGDTGPADLAPLDKLLALAAIPELGPVVRTSHDEPPLGLA